MAMINWPSGYRWAHFPGQWTLHVNHGCSLTWLKLVLFTAPVLLGGAHYIVVASLSESDRLATFTEQAHRPVASPLAPDVAVNDQLDIFMPNDYRAWPSLFALPPRKPTPELPVSIAHPLPEITTSIHRAASPPRWQLEIQRPEASASQLQNAMLRVRQYLAIADDVQARQALNDVLLMDAHHVEALMVMVALLQRIGDDDALQHYQMRLSQQLPEVSEQTMDDVAWQEGAHD